MTLSQAFWSCARKDITSCFKASFSCWVTWRSDLIWDIWRFTFCRISSRFWTCMVRTIVYGDTDIQGLTSRMSRKNKQENRPRPLATSKFSVQWFSGNSRCFIYVQDVQLHLWKKTKQILLIRYLINCQGMGPELRMPAAIAKQACGESWEITFESEVMDCRGPLG